MTVNLKDFVTVASAAELKEGIEEMDSPILMEEAEYEKLVGRKKQKEIGDPYIKSQSNPNDGNKNLSRRVSDEVEELREYGNQWKTSPSVYNLYHSAADELERANPDDPEYHLEAWMEDQSSAELTQDISGRYSTTTEPEYNQEEVEELRGMANQYSGRTSDMLHKTADELSQTQTEDPEKTVEELLEKYG